MSDSVPTTMGCAGWGQQGRRVLKGLGCAAPLPVAGQARLLWQVEGCSILGEVGPGFSAPCSQSSGPGWGLGGEASHQPQEHSERQGHGSRAGGSSLHSPQHRPDSAGDAGFPPFASTQSPGTAVPNHGAPWQLLCQAGQEASPASPAQGSCPQTQELPLCQGKGGTCTWLWGRMSCLLDSRSGEGSPILAGRAGTPACCRAGDRHKLTPCCLGAGDAHGAELASSLLGLWLGWGSPWALRGSAPLRLRQLPLGILQVGTGTCWGPERHWLGEGYLQPRA